jgi:hypothetical protein
MTGSAATHTLEISHTVLIVSCYELGHQSFAVASAWAELKIAGFNVVGADASIESPSDETLAHARLVAISVPMHTALRLGVEIARRVRVVNPAAHICFFGLYASLNAVYLLDGIVDSVIAGEFEPKLVELALALARPSNTTGHSLLIPMKPNLRKLNFLRPHREELPSLDNYARLLGPAQGEERLVGYVEASRGCLHKCLHCPITPVYGGRFFVVPRDIVLSDARQQIEAGARHITFGDPDFLNGPGHSMAVVSALHEEHPGITFDITVKVEHIIKYKDRFSQLASLGCIFVVSAVESLSDRVLEELEKGHKRADVIEAINITRQSGIALRPSLLAFTPWTTLSDYIELCEFIFEQDLVDHVDPIQLAIRLLLPPGSAILSRDVPRSWLGPLVAADFGYTWVHPDPRMDALHAMVSRIVEVGTQCNADALETLRRIRVIAYEAAGQPMPGQPIERPRRFVPKLSEPWFCCAEPSAAQLGQVTSCKRKNESPITGKQTRTECQTPAGQSSSRGDNSNPSSANEARSACST